MKNIIICADDYAMSPQISDGIVDLLSMGRLSAVSCMSTAPDWSAHAPDLLKLESSCNSFDIGLHLCFTEPFSTPYWSLPVLLLRSSMHLLPARMIRDAIARQLDLFENAVGRAPDFIDGHQHVHAGPQIRACLELEIAQRYGARTPFLRVIRPLNVHTNARLKQFVLGTWTHGFNALLARNHWCGNSALAGLYDLQTVGAFEYFMPLWLESLPENGLVFCHPANAQLIVRDRHDDHDALLAIRHHEYQYLQSDEFAKLCQQQKIKISRFRAPEQAQLEPQKLSLT